MCVCVCVCVCIQLQRAQLKLKLDSFKKITVLTFMLQSISNQSMIFAHHSSVASSGSTDSLSDWFRVRVLTCLPTLAQTNHCASNLGADASYS